jgi:Tfp pilus assembly protein PilF
MLEKAIELMGSERWSETIVLLRQHEAEVQSDARLARALGWAYLKVDDHASAVVWLERAVALMPASALNTWALGSALLEAERWTEAEHQLLRSLAIRDSYLSRMALAFLYQQAGRLTEAEAVHNEGVRLMPHDGRRLGAYADFLSDIGRTEEAARYYASARTADPPDDNDEN